MSHKRSDIRDALKLLLTGTSPTFATAAEDRVYSNRAYNVDRIKLPAIHIYEENETATARDIRSSGYVRRLTTKIDLLVTSSTDISTELDDLAQEVEDILSENRTISGTATGSVLQSTELSFEPGEKTVGRATLTYEITYLT